MKIMELVLNALFKKGLLYEGENVNIEAYIPVKDPRFDMGIVTPNDVENSFIKIVMGADNMTIRVEKENKDVI